MASIVPSRRLLAGFAALRDPRTLRTPAIRLGHSSSSAASHPSLWRRHASNKSKAQPSSSKGKPIYLEKPARFNPPSHGSRLPSGKNKERRQEAALPRSYGPELTEEQRAKQYPHMMPNEGTFMHWFLTNRAIHAWITLVSLLRPHNPDRDPRQHTRLHIETPTSKACGNFWLTSPSLQGILLSLTFYTILQNFHHNTPFLHLLPPTSMLLTNPFAYVAQYARVYRLHVEHTSAETAERRRRRVDDARKRREYRKAHGIPDTGFGGWSAKQADEKEEGAVVGGDAEVAAVVAEGVGPDPVKAAEYAEQAEKVGAGVYTDFEGRKKPVKKWLGIW